MFIALFFNTLLLKSLFYRFFNILVPLDLEHNQKQPNIVIRYFATSNLQEKCGNYWGKSVGEVQKWGNFTVTLISEQRENMHIVRTLQLKCAEVSRVCWGKRGFTLLFPL